MNSYFPPRTIALLLLRYNHDDRPNPYNKGILRNCFEVLCVPVPPSQVGLRV